MLAPRVGIRALSAARAVGAPQSTRSRPNPRDAAEADTATASSRCAMDGSLGLGRECFAPATLNLATTLTLATTHILEPSRSLSSCATDGADGNRPGGAALGRSDRRGCEPRSTLRGGRPYGDDADRACTACTRRETGSRRHDVRCHRHGRELDHFLRRCACCAPDGADGSSCRRESNRSRRGYWPRISGSRGASRQRGIGSRTHCCSHDRSSRHDTGRAHSCVGRHRRRA